MAARTLPLSTNLQTKAAAGNAGAGTPNQSLYVKNLNDKINIDDLKRALYMLFSTYGPVLDIVTVRVGKGGQKMRGQAHVVFRDIQTSTQAMRGLQNFEFFGKEMRIAYAKGESSIIPKLRGTFEPVSEGIQAQEGTTAPTSIFNAPPPGVPVKPTSNGMASDDSAAPHGVKRLHDEVEAEDDAPMEEDEDDAPMDEDDDE